MQTERLALRQYSSLDVDVMMEILGDPITMQFWPQPFNRKETLDWVSRAIDSYADHGFGRWVVERKNDHEVIGDCGILRLEVNGSMEFDLGYIIHHQWWNLGYGCEAARAAMDYALRELQLRRLVAGMADNHYGSARVAEKLGMTLESKFYNPGNSNQLTRLYSIED